MGLANTFRCRQCGNELQAGSSQDGLCQQCRASSLADDAPPTADATTAGDSGASSARVLPDHIGPYKVLDFLGEGGMGAVYLAEQEQPIRRKVALKVIKLGMDTKEVIARFESERQALAMMNHPNIAQVHDAGTTDRGAPYFVMEYIAGVPIADYCDRHRLSTRERLEIFIPVCQAIQHAHQKGIIHRDIKPSNILVAVQDGKPVPKIIDFGVAKATNQRLTEKTVFTQQGYLIGTPEYMSPEQAEMTGLDVDTTTDIYSLGVLLYELLVGALPFDPRALRRAGFDEIRRIIREVDPPKPTTRLSSLGPLAKGIAERRHTDVVSLVKELRGDIDWITLKAMEKDRTRRYASSSELAADIERHLRNEPVAACPPTSLYRVRKFVRRHRMGVGVAAAAVVVLIAFAATMAVQAQRIARQRDRAERVSAFLVSLFEASDPDRSKGDRLTARELLDTGVARLGRELANEPETRAALLHTIGSVYFQLGRDAAAERALEQALPFRRTLSGRERLDLAATLNELGKVYFRKGDYVRAEAVFREVLDTRRRVLGADHPDIGKSLHNLATLAEQRGQLAEAEALYKQALPLLKKADNPAESGFCLMNLSGLYWRQGKLSDALDTSREALDLLRRTLGVEHSWTLDAMNSYAHDLYEVGEYAQAEQLQREVLATRRKLLGDSHFDVGVGYYNLGNTLDEQGRFAEAEQALRESLAIWRRTLPDPHVQTAWALNDLAIVLTDQRRCADAEPLYREALAMFQKVKDSDPASAAWSLHGLGDVYACRGQISEAEKHYRAALELRKKTLGNAHTNVADTEAALGRLLTERGAYEEADRLLRNALEIRRKSLPSTHWRIGYTQALLGSCLKGERRFDEAETLLLAGYETLRTKRGDGREETLSAASGLVALYEAWGKPGKAAEWQKKLADTKAKKAP
jgi:serine/threonine protein kinase/tetratricopeptide (TPR) repeat protein